MPWRSGWHGVGSALAAFGRMLICPADGVMRVLTVGPGLRPLAVWLAGIGLLRGCVEALWDYLMTGSIGQLPWLLTQPAWYYRWGGPFILVNIPSTWFLWFTMAILLHLTARLLGGQGSFRQLLQVTGVAMFSYLVVGLLNYLHLFWAMPSITLHASPSFRPNLGTGQLAVFVWLIVVCYQAVRRIYQLPRGSALL
ncbi:MAG: YIP1 family protein, partial [Mycobacterium leprae]